MRQPADTQKDARENIPAHTMEDVPRAKSGAEVTASAATIITEAATTASDEITVMVAVSDKCT